MPISIEDLTERTKALNGVKIWNKRNKNTPPYAKYCGRPTGYGNPFEVGRHGARGQCCDMFLAWLVIGDWRHINDVDCPAATEERRQWILSHVHELKGQDLECWCCDLYDGMPMSRLTNRCHCETLARLANKEQP